MQIEEFGAFIQQLRNEKGYTQAQLADILGVTDKAVSKWERGLCLPDISNFDSLASALDVTVAELVECRRKDAEPIDVEDIIRRTMDITHRDTRRRMSRAFNIVLLCIGVLMMLVGCADYALEHMFDTNITTAVGVIGGADGPTAIFVSGRAWIAGVLVPVGVLIIIGAIISTIRNKK